MCREDLPPWSGLNFHKFWQGVQSSIALTIREDILFSHALLTADYLFADYAGILTEAELSGSSADLCSQASRYYTCKHGQMSGTLRSYISSRQWWREGFVDNSSSREYLWARQAAMEWFTAHFGLDAAYLLPLALVGVVNKRQYFATLAAYTDRTPAEIFAGVDAYVKPMFGLEASQ